MDEHASKSLNVGASVAIALGIITLVFMVVAVAVRITNAGVAKASKLTGQIEESTYTQYDGQIVKGDQVLAIIQQFKDDNIAICVETGGSTTTDYIYSNGVTWDKSAATCSFGTSADKMSSREIAVALQTAQTRGDAKYIAPTGDFACTVCRDGDTQGITGLYFELQ